MPSSLLAITICATKSYTYAMRAQAHKVVANIFASEFACGVIVLSGDDSPELADVAKLYEQLLPEGWTTQLLVNPGVAEGGKNYKAKAQLLIARLRTTAFAYCRKIKVSRTWSLDSDVLPPSNALRCMQTMLEFDNGYYSISTCPYMNNGFLGGFGSPRHHIAEDFLDSERVVPPELKAELASNEAEAKQLAETKTKPTDAQRDKWAATKKKVRECPPDGNIWQVIAKHGWRRRGWLDKAYPAIGLGSVVPSDWCGFGCTLMNAEALALADFSGYEGKGTEDLYVCWLRWHPAGLRLNVITHCPCDHVIWEKKKGGDPAKYTHHVVYHEAEGELRGHLRARKVSWNPEAVADPTTGGTLITEAEEAPKAEVAPSVEATPVPVEAQ
jgi:hypothetical protein